MQKVVYYEEDHGKHFTSVFTCKLIYREPGRDFHELTEHNRNWYRLDRMKASRYDGIRDTLPLAEAGRGPARTQHVGDHGDVRRAKLSGSCGTTPRFAKHTRLVGITEGFAL